MSDPVDDVDGGISWLVVARGGASACLLAVPAALANSAFAGQQPKAQVAVNVSFLVVLVGFVLGGLVAGLEAHDQAAKHGALAAVAAFIPVEVLAIMGRLDRGDQISIGAIIITGLLAACAGTVGAQLGASRRARRNTP